MMKTVVGNLKGRKCPLLEYDVNEYKLSLSSLE
jgi:hypothetical protein